MGRHSTLLEPPAAGSIPRRPRAGTVDDPRVDVVRSASARGAAPLPSPARQAAVRQGVARPVVHEVVEDETPIPDSARRPAWRVLQHDGASVAPDLTGRSLLTDPDGRSRARRAVRAATRRGRFQRRELLLCAAALVVFGSLSGAAAIGAGQRADAPGSSGVSAPEHIVPPANTGTGLQHPAPALYDDAAEARSASAASQNG